MTLNDRERYILESQERAIRDAKTNKRYYFEEGKEAGMQEGIVQGKEIGIAQGKEVGMRQERLDAIEMMLRLKFGSDGSTLMDEVRKIDDLSQLRELQQALLAEGTIQDFRDRLA